MTMAIPASSLSCVKNVEYGHSGTGVAIDNATVAAPYAAEDMNGSTEENTKNEMEDLDEGFIEYKSKSAVKAERRRLEAEHRLVEATKSLAVDSLPELAWGPIDVKKLSHLQDIQLRNGPTVAIFCDGKLLRKHVPKRAFMAVSMKAHRYLGSNPLLSEIHLESGHVDIDSLVYLLKLLDKRIAVFATNIGTGKAFIHGVKIYEAALFLGFGNFLGSLKYRLCGTVSSRLISYAELNAAIACLPPNDAIFKHIAADLSYRRHKKLIPDPADFEHYLMQNISLKDAMDAVDAHHAAARKASRKKHC